MNTLYRLPRDIFTEIYSYDDTYKSVYTHGPIFTLNQIIFYKRLICRNKMYIKVIRRNNFVIDDIIKKEIIEEIKLRNVYVNKHSVDFYEKLYNIFGRLYIKCCNIT